MACLKPKVKLEPSSDNHRCCEEIGVAIVKLGLTPMPRLAPRMRNVVDRNSGDIRSDLLERLGGKLVGTAPNSEYRHVKFAKGKLV